MRATWAQMKAAQIGAPIGLCPDSPQLLELTNEAIKILWDAGDWVGKRVRYRIQVTRDCDNNPCITWPRQIETIEMAEACDLSIGVRNQSFEFLENATGDLSRWGSTRLLGDRSEVVSFLDIVPNSKKLKVHTQRVEDASKQIILLGYDDDDIWIRTQVDGQWVDGEYIDLSTAPQTTTNFFSKLTGVIFLGGDRDGNTYLYEVDTLDGDSERWLSTYEYDEATPVYRRSILTGLPKDHCECVTVLAKTRFQPIKNDTDYIQISNVAAIKSCLLYIYKRDAGKNDEATSYLQSAIAYLNNELKQYNGSGAKRMIRFNDAATWAATRNLQ